jgi:hypothetical protein
MRGSRMRGSFTSRTFGSSVVNGRSSEVRLTAAMNRVDPG